MKAINVYFTRDKGEFIEADSSLPCVLWVDSGDFLPATEMQRA
jgi:hypothetical protein